MTATTTASPAPGFARKPDYREMTAIRDYVAFHGDRVEIRAGD